MAKILIVFSATSVILILLIIAAVAQNYANESYSSSGNVGGTNGIFATHYSEDERRIRNEENRRKYDNYHRHGNYHHNHRHGDYYHRHDRYDDPRYRYW